MICGLGFETRFDQIGNITASFTVALEGAIFVEIGNAFDRKLRGFTVRFLPSVDKVSEGIPAVKGIQMILPLYGVYIRDAGFCTVFV